MEYITDPHKAEKNATQLMRQWGFADAVAGTGGADGGVDVRSKRALAQVKWKGGVVGRPDVQRLVGARGTGSEALIFFSASGYSAQAIEYADQVGVALFTYDPTGTPEAVNRSAKQVMAQPMSVLPTLHEDVRFFGALLAALVPALLLLIYLNR
ncbi:restriction endonuclease [Dietzia maris]|nr:restriction endonuclease [Dietzia maris]MBB0998291.1 restriction endonuclease [Dietzia maris]